MAVSVAQALRNIIGTPATSSTVTMTSAATHATLVYGWYNRTDASTLSGVADEGGAFTSRGTTPSGGSAISSVWDRQDVTTDTSNQIVGTTAGNVNSQNLGLVLTSDAGGVAYPIFSAAATPNRGEPIDGTNDTTHTSNAVTLAESSGLIVGFIFTNNSQATTPTATITRSGDSPVSATVEPAGGAGVRAFVAHLAVSLAGDYTVTWTLPSTAQSSCYALAYTDDTGGGDPAPSITDVDGDDTITLEQQDIVTNVSDEDSETIEVRQGGFDYVLSGNAASADMPTIGATGPISAPHAGSAVWAVINGDDQEDTINITITDETGTETYLIGTPNADPDLRLTASADAEAGDYVRISNVQGGTVADVTVNDDLTWSAEEAVTAFDVQYWDSGDGTWGDRETQTVSAEANSGPVFDGPNIANLELVIDEAMTPRDYSGRFSDADEDELTFEIVGTLPTGLDLSTAGVLSGTPTELGTTSSLEIRASDGTDTADSNSFSIEIIEAPDWTGVAFIGGLAVDESGRIGTNFLGDVEPVPEGSYFHGGFAHADDGRRYVAEWPGDDLVFYNGGIATRPDGAMVIAASGDPACYINGWALTARGEVLASSSVPEVIKGGIGLRANGLVCMEEIA